MATLVMLADGTLSGKTAQEQVGLNPAGGETTAEGPDTDQQLRSRARPRSGTKATYLMQHTHKYWQDSDKWYIALTFTECCRDCVTSNRKHS